MARFDLYADRKAWWWVFFLSVAVAKDKPYNHGLLIQMLFDAIDYEDNYNTIDRKAMFSKYGIKGYTK